MKARRARSESAQATVCLLVTGLGALLGPGLEPLSAQQHAPKAHSKDSPWPKMQPPKPLSPGAALFHLQRGNRLICAGQVGKLRRPSGAGKYLAAVVLSAGLPKTAAEIFAIEHRDLLVLSSPGPSLRAAELSALERATTKEQLSLVVILVDPEDPSLSPAQTEPPADRPAARILWRQAKAASELAAKEKISLAAAHGILQADRIWRSSKRLHGLYQQRKFHVAVGVVERKHGQDKHGRKQKQALAVDWVTRWEQHWQLQPGLRAKPQRAKPQKAKPQK